MLARMNSTGVRFDTAIDALLVGCDGRWRHHCKISEVSDVAALLIVFGFPERPEYREFFLLLSTRGTVKRRCQFVRADNSTVIVRFLCTEERRKRWVQVQRKLMIADNLLSISVVPTQARATNNGLGRAARYWSA